MEGRSKKYLDDDKNDITSEGPQTRGEFFPMDSQVSPILSHVSDTVKGETHTLQASNTWGENRDSNTITSPTHQSDQGKNKINGDRSNPKISLGICVERCSKDIEMFEETIKKLMKR